ncbi:MAG: AAA family ATPase, partial [Oscillospiraceae bacterium]|nr:AAA family ATPase [Oscillospiraceae bacterium]
MGIYLNPDNDSFKKIAKDEIYIDKSGLLKILNKKLGAVRNCVSLSHARRFGKSQAADMIEAYYSRGCNSEELFSDLEISKSPDFKKHLNKYNVIHLDIASMTDNMEGNYIPKITELIYNELKAEYPDILKFGNPLSAILMDVYNKTETEQDGKRVKIPFVIIIDEWDCIIRNHSDDPKLVHDYMKFLHSLFKSKEATSFLGLGYMTGILPIKKIKDESALNNFKEYTMTDSKELTPYFGFTDEEVKDLCTRYNMNYESVREWYDGYSISGKDMYNPDSVSQAVTDHSLESYWKNTSAFESINTYITMNFDGLKEDVLSALSGKSVPVNIRKFKNDLSEIGSRDDALTALIHLGYLGYNALTGEAYLPNYEVAEAYEAALSTGNWNEVAKSISQCRELLNATIRRNEERVAELTELAHETYSSVLKYNDENALSCAITMAYFTAPAYYNIIREYPSGNGFADL